MKGKLFQERYIRGTNVDELSKLLLTFVNTLEFFKVFGSFSSKRNKKCKICYYNFAFWKIETIVDFKCQKQSPWSVLKILIEMLRKLNGFLLNSRFCSCKIFHWYLITDLIISKDLSFGFLILTSPY